MSAFDAFLEQRLSRGHLSFTREELLRALSAGSTTLTTSLSRLVRQGRIANPRPGFYLILRAKDKAAGAPEPAQWIHALMKHQKMDYRISLLTAARQHGAGVEAPAFQVIVPRPLADFAIGRHRLEFTPQPQAAFARANRDEWLHELKTESGTALAAGIELTLLDCARWFHKAGGVSRVTQVARELGERALPKKLASAARACDNAAVMRLGYFLELAGHEAQAKALDQFAEQAKLKLLDPNSKEEPTELSGRWKIAVNK